MDIPELDIAMQATEVVEPVTRWGRISRKAEMPGTYHLFTDDYRFTMLKRRPWMLPATGCKVAVEPNFSTWPEMGRLAATDAICWKRRLARAWQDCGVRIIVDLNVDPAFRHLSLLGVPEGWRAYATRQHRGIAPSAIEDDHRQAVAHAGTPDILFCVFGGWRKVRDLCRERGWRWTAEDIHRARGSTDGTRKWE